MKKQYKRGFTLVELLAVLVVLAIVLAIAIPAIAGIIEGA
ncbi:MAG: prepilin-type N-terminal cleavage/methylation domain-containing protein, partial [Bacilli bacterium]